MGWSAVGIGLLPRATVSGMSTKLYIFFIEKTEWECMSRTTDLSTLFVLVLIVPEQPTLSLG